METMKAQNIKKAGENTAFVAGGGKFGTRAVEYLKEKGRMVLVVDPDEHCKARKRVNTISTPLKAPKALRKGEAVLVIGDAGEILLEILKVITPSLIIPAIPKHFFASVVQDKLENEGLTITPAQENIYQIKEKLPEDLISTVNEKEATLITSYMEKELKCREDCSQPSAICPRTGKTKTRPMYKILDSGVSSLDINFSKIFRSKQFIPGVGGISGKSLFRFLNEEIKNTQKGKFVIGTACKCHGVLTLLKIRSG